MIHISLSIIMDIGFFDIEAYVRNKFISSNDDSSPDSVRTREMLKWYLSASDLKRCGIVVEGWSHHEAVLLLSSFIELS